MDYGYSNCGVGSFSIMDQSNPSVYGSQAWHAKKDRDTKWDPKKHSRRPNPWPTPNPTPPTPTTTNP